MNERRAAWTFVAPSLIVIGAFFLVPVLAALALSLTDFDLCVGGIDYRNFGAPCANEHSAEVRGRPFHRDLCGHLICRTDHREAGQSAGQGQVLNGHL